MGGRADRQVGKKASGWAGGRQADEQKIFEPSLIASIVNMHVAACKNCNIHAVLKTNTKIRLAEHVNECKSADPACEFKKYFDRESRVLSFSSALQWGWVPGWLCRGRGCGSVTLSAISPGYGGVRRLVPDLPGVTFLLKLL